MRTAASFRLLLSPSPCSPPPATTYRPDRAPGAARRGRGGTRGEAVPVRQDPGAALLGDRAHWADGYLVAGDPTTASYGPGPSTSFNRSGGPITITKPAGTTGRYIVTFSGLSTHLGGRNTVHATGFGHRRHLLQAGRRLPGRRQGRGALLQIGHRGPSQLAFTLLVTRNYSTSPSRTRTSRPAPTTLPALPAPGIRSGRPRSSGPASATTTWSSIPSGRSFHPTSTATCR